MKLFKLLTSGLVLAVIGLFIYQNIPAFEQSVHFQLNLYIQEKTEWFHPVYILLLIAVCIGFFTGILLMLKPYFNIRRLLTQERQEKQEKQAKHEKEEVKLQSAVPQTTEASAKEKDNAGSTD